MGRRNVLLTHPLSRDVPRVLSRKVEVPAGKNTAVEFSGNNHPKGGWKLVIRIDGTEILDKSIEDSPRKKIRVGLTKYAGKAIASELENHSTGWAFEAAYWSRIEIESE
ncbi:MAG: hypothetical protein OSA98_21790 [Rubripirellula sp.]|nr:hypothetical protein [Rubripirellula sp.]